MRHLLLAAGLALTAAGTWLLQAISPGWGERPPGVWTALALLLAGVLAMTVAFALDARIVDRCFGHAMKAPPAPPARGTR